MKKYVYKTEKGYITEAYFDPEVTYEPFKYTDDIYEAFLFDTRLLTFFDYDGVEVIEVDVQITIKE